MFIVIIVGTLLLWLSFYLGFIRNGQVYKFVMRLLSEENEWWNAHLETHWQQLEGKHFLRQASLPSSNRMWLIFWLPLSYWEKKLKPFEYYYGINKKTRWEAD